MVNTRMEGRLEQLEKNAEESFRVQATLAGRLTGIEASLANILESLRRRNTPSPPRRQRQEEGEGERREEREMVSHRKLELPLFDGEDPLGWIFKVERYFSVNGVEEQEKVDAAIVSLEGKALTWFQWHEARAPIRQWPEFKAEVIERFHCKQMGDEWEQLLALKQLGTMEEYREKFETLSAPLRDVTEEVLSGGFLEWHEGEHTV